MKAFGVVLASVLVIVLLSPGTLVNLAAPSQRPQPTGTSYLPTSVINSACPNLPTASSLLAGNSLNLLIVDPSTSATVVRNSSTTVFGFKDGVIYPGYVSLFVTNGKVWVEVPESILQMSGCAAALAGYAQSSPAQASVSQPGTAYAVTPITWALGGYSNPGSISHSAAVTGAQSYTYSAGTWSPNTANCPNSVCYLGYDVLSIVDNLVGYQLVLNNRYPHDAATNAQGYEAVVQAWNLGTGAMIFSYEIAITYSPSQNYPMSIQYDAGTNRWDYYFNGNLLGSSTLAGGENPFMTVGNQPSVVVESDDSTQGDFSGFSSKIGYNTIAFYCPCLYYPAISYYFNGQWNPAFIASWPPSQPTPAGYVYYGGSTTYTIFAVGNNGPPTWIGLSSSFDQMNFCISGSSGCTTPPPAQATLMWGPIDVEAQSAQGHNTCSPTCTTSFTVSFPNQVKKGDLLTVMVGTYTTGVTFGVSDPTGSGGQGNTWTSAISKCINDCVQIFYATAKSTSSDTITITTNPATQQYTYAFIVEFNGAISTLDTTAYCASSCSGTIHTSTFSPARADVIVDVAAETDFLGGWSAGSRYTMVGGSTGWAAGSEWAVGFIWSTNAPWATTNDNWGEVAAAFK